MWKILIPLLLLLAVIFIQLRRVEGFDGSTIQAPTCPTGKTFNPATNLCSDGSPPICPTGWTFRGGAGMCENTTALCTRMTGTYSVNCTTGAVLNPQGTAVPSTCGYKVDITGVITDPNGGVCGSVPAACKGWAFNGSGVWTNFNLVSNTASVNPNGVGHRGTGGLSTGGYTGSYLGNPSVDTTSINSQLGNIWGGFSGTTPTFGTPGTTTTTGTTTPGTTTVLPPTTTTTTTTTQDASGNSVDASGNAVPKGGSGVINLSLADLIALFGSTATGTSAPPTAATPSNNPATSTTAGQDFYNQFRPMLLDDINKAIEAKATTAPASAATATTEADTSCSPSLQQGTDFSTAQNNIQYNQEYIRKDSIPCYACSL